MKKLKAKKETMLAEYDFSSDTKGKYAKLYKQGTNWIAFRRSNLFKEAALEFCNFVNYVKK